MVKVSVRCFLNILWSQCVVTVYFPSQESLKDREEMAVCLSKIDLFFIFLNKIKDYSNMFKKNPWNVMS